MATVSLENLTKVYPNGSTAVSDLSLEVADGEFMVLVGPSGCGKTTALRMVAGLEDISEGTVKVGERVVNELSPRERDIAMVFQNYALYPHMTVAENIGFALKLKKLPKAEIRQKVEEAAGILGLTEHLDRKPNQLSGGQRQRVAMGRAIVRQPAVFLMDEPLSNLDAKLRVQMRAEIARVQRRLGVATIYVTHDQTEAMTMGDRVAVMRAGTLLQCDIPQVLYDEPANLFVAGFIGSPAMNLYEGTISADGKQVSLGSQSLELPPAILASPIGPYFGKPVVVGIRPENLNDAALRRAAGNGASSSASAGSGSGSGSPAEGRRLEGDVDLVEALGSEKLVHFRIDASRVHAVVQSAGAVDPEDQETPLTEGELGTAAMTVAVARVEPTSMIKAGERAVFAVDIDRLQLFDPESGKAIRDGHQPVEDASVTE